MMDGRSLLLNIYYHTMKENKAIIITDIDNEMIIQQVQIYKNTGEIINTKTCDQIEIMNTLCEGIITLIHKNNKDKVQKDFIAIKNCIDKITNGFLIPQ